MTCPFCQNEMTLAGPPVLGKFYRCEVCTAFAREKVRNLIAANVPRFWSQRASPVVMMPWQRTYRDGTVRPDPWPAG